MDLEKEERLEKVGGGIRGVLEEETRSTLMKEANKEGQSLMSGMDGSPSMSTSIYKEHREDDEEDTKIHDYKREKEEEEEEEGQFTSEEVGIMASKYPYSTLYKNMKVSKKAGSPWFVLQNNGRTVAIVPAAPAAQKSQKQADLAAQSIVRDVATHGLVATLKHRSGRIAQAGDPGVVGGGVRDFIPLSDPAADQSVAARPDFDTQSKRTRLWEEPVSPGEFPDHTRPHDPKDLSDRVMDERTTDFEISETSAPPMPLNVTDRQDSDMRYDRDSKTVMDNVLNERATDMKNAAKNLGTREAQGRGLDFGPRPENGRRGPEEEPPAAGAVPLPELPGTVPPETPAPPGGVPFPEQPRTLPRTIPEGPQGGTPIRASKDKVAVTPPGMTDVVDALKKQPQVDNPWAVAWSMYNKEKEGQTAHKAQITQEELEGMPDVIQEFLTAPEPGATPEAAPSPAPAPTTDDGLLAPIQPTGPGTVNVPSQEQMPHVEGRRANDEENGNDKEKDEEKDGKCAADNENGNDDDKEKENGEDKDGKYAADNDNGDDKDDKDKENGEDKDGKCKASVSVSSEDFNAIIADIEGRLAKKFERKSESWKKAFAERLMRSILLAADRQRLNQEPCSLKMAMGDILEQPQKTAGVPIEGLDGDAIFAIVEASFQNGSTPYVQSIVRQAIKFLDMPQEAFLTIEADTKKLMPVDIRRAQDENGNGENGDDEDESLIEEIIEEEVEEEIEKESQNDEDERDEENGNGEENEEEREAMRRRASNGNLMLAPSPQGVQPVSGRHPMVREAMKDSLVSQKFPKLTGRY